MTCESCGDKPKKCNKDFTRTVVEIDNPEQITLMRKVTIPASMGDDTTVPPVIGKYKNVLLYYEANSKSYLYSSDDIPTLLANGLTDYEQAVNLPQINGVTLVDNKTATQLGLQDKLTAGANITIDNNVISAEGGIKKLTTADYDYPANNPTSVAIWNLPDGVYHSASGVSVVLNTQEGYSLDTVWTVHNNGTYACYTRNTGSTLSYGVTKMSDGAPAGYSSLILRESNLANNLTTTVTGKALDARQGKVLNEKIPVITMQAIDPGEGTALAENHFIAVYNT